MTTWIFSLFSLLFLAVATTPTFAQQYRNTITVILENSSSLPNRVQVRDMEARLGFSEDCRVAKKVARACERDPGRELKGSRESRMTCAAALALVEEPRCSIKDLIFDDWMDGDTSVELTVHVGRNGFGMVGVRAVNNTESWTIKPGLRDGDTVQQQ